MTRKTQISLLAVLALIAIAPSANAQIASKEYVDDELAGKMNTMTVDATPTDDSTNLVTSGGVYDAIAAATYDDTVLAGRVTAAEGDIDTIEGRMNDFAGAGHTMEHALYALAIDDSNQMSDSILVTSDNGQIITVQKLNLKALNFPTPPAACAAQGCMLMFYNNQYVWELVARENNETISTTGSVTNGARVYSGNQYALTKLGGSVVCDHDGYEVAPDSTTCAEPQPATQQEI